MPVRIDSRAVISRLSIAFFLSLLSILVSYAILSGKGYRLPIVLFWVPFVGSISVFMLHSLDFLRVSDRLVVAEMILLILVASFMFSLLSPFYSWGYDSSYTIDSTVRITEGGWPIPEGGAPNTPRLVSDWPLDSILVSSLHQVGSVGWGDILRYVPSCIYPLIGASLFLWGRKCLLLSVRNCAILGAIGPLTYGFTILNGLGNSGLGIALLFFTVFLVGRAGSSRPDYRFSFIAAIAVVALVLSHHLSTFYLIFICLFFLSYRLSHGRISSGSKAVAPNVSRSWHMSIRISTVALICTLALFFWTGVGTSVVLMLYQGFVGAATVQIISSPTSFFSNMPVAVSIILDGALVMVMLFAVVRERKRGTTAFEKSSGWPLLLFAAVLMLTVIASGRIGSFHAEFSRSMGIAFAFVLAAFLAARNSWKGSFLKSVVLVFVLVLVYSSNQVYRIDATTGILQPNSAPQYSNTGYVWGGFMNMEDLDAVLWFPEQERVIGDQVIYSLGEGWKNMTVEPIPEVFKGNLSAANSIRWLFLREVDQRFVFIPYQSTESFGVSSSTLNILDNTSKTFDNGGVSIFLLSNVA